MVYKWRGKRTKAGHCIYKKQVPADEVYGIAGIRACRTGFAEAGII